jgi:F420-dependent oxidoreductase-like protein
MRFAIKTSPQHTTWGDMLDVWRAADGVDVFESAWLFDHFYPIFSDPTGDCLEGWTALAALAAATERIRLGVMVTGMPYRHPAVLANMVATIDVIANGRLELGLGAGWNEEECDAYGIALGTLKERFDRFDEGVEAIASLLANDRTTFAGDYVRLNDAMCNPKPVQRPYPPIWIGGGGEKRTLRTVARWAAYWNMAGGEPATFAAKLAVLRDHCAALGRDPAEVTPTTQLRVPEDGDYAPLAEQVAAFGAVGCELVVLMLPPPHRAAAVEPLAEALRAMA